MPSGQHQQSFAFPGYTFNSMETPVTFDSMSVIEVDLPAVAAANTGTLTTRTDDNTGVATLGAGHTIISSDVVDVYWAGGVRYGMTATVAGAAVTVDLGAGDVLPAQDTAVTVVLQMAINPLNLDGDNAKLVGVFYRNVLDQTANAHINFQDSGSASIAEHDLVHETANGGLTHIYNIAAGDTNPYTGNPITKGVATHDSASVGKLYVLAGIDSTP